MNSNLSPEAQAVWVTFNDVLERVGTFEDFGEALATALRTAVEQVRFSDTESSAVEQILSIAQELEK